MAMPHSIAPVTGTGVITEKGSSRVDKIAVGIPDREIRTVKLSEYKEAAASIAEAFRHDLAVRYPIDTPDRAHWSEEERFALHQKAFEYITYAHCLNGLVTATGENYGAVALWMPPGKNMDDWLTIVRSGMWRLIYQLSGEGRKRFFDEFLPLLHDTKADVLGERDPETWYLVYIGTRPESRCNGHARRLIEHITKKAGPLTH